MRIEHSGSRTLRLLTLFLAITLGLVMSGFAYATIVSLEPDIYSSGTHIPTNQGVRLSIGNLANLTLRAYSGPFTGTSYYGILPSTGSNAYGYGSTSSFIDPIFDQYRTFEAVMDVPTSYVAVDVLWPYEAGYYGTGSYGFSEGVTFTAYDANNNVLHSEIHQPGAHGTDDRLSLFNSGIKRVIVSGYDASGPSGGNYFGTDHFVFNGPSPGFDLTLEEGQTVQAPDGLNLESGDNLSGNGIIEGNLNNLGGTISPGTSAGEISIAGAFSQNTDGITVMEVGSTASDKLSIEGEANFDGILDLILLGDLALSEGQILELMVYDSLGNGRFKEIRGLDSLGGNFDIIYGDSSLQLIGTSQVPLPAGIWLLGTSLIGLAGLRKKISK